MSSTQKSLSTTYIAAVIAISLWGFSFVWTNILLNYRVPVFTFLFIRLAIAGILLLVFSRLIGKLQKINLKDFLWLSLMAFSEPFIYFIGESYGMKATHSPTICAVIIASIPVFCLFVEKIFYRVPFTFYKVIGIALTLPGILLVVFEDGPLSAEHAYGIALLFLAVAGATGYATVVKKLSGKYNTYTIATYQFLMGAFFFLPFFLIWGTDGLTREFFTWKIQLPLLSLAILCSCIAFGLFITVIRNIGITRANIFSTLIPAVSAAGAAMLGQEAITFSKIAGISIVIAGVILAQHTKK